MKLVLCMSTLSCALAFAPSKPVFSSSALSESVAEETPAPAASSAYTKDDLVELAGKLNPAIKFYDPIGLADAEMWGMSNEATIGWLRQAEIKHSRVAMAAFVGYCVQSNFVFPWPQTLEGAAHPSVDLSPEEQWDAVPVNAKWQILAVIGALELWDECGGAGAMEHYTKGRQPGKYPSFDLFRDNVHFVLDLYDPFGFNKKMTDETKEKRLRAEINNGRLAMLGIFGFLCADTIPGSVPTLSNIAIPYDGNPMIPFEGQFSLFG